MKRIGRDLPAGRQVTQPSLRSYCLFNARKGLPLKVAMHEFSICRTILDAVLEELKRAGGRRLKRARVVAGACHQIVPDNLRSAYEALSKNTPAEGSRLEIDPRPIAAACKRCGWRGTIEGFVYACGRCGAGDIELTGGKELYLDQLEIEQDEDR